MMQSIEINEMAINRVDMIKSVHKFVEQANQNKRRINDDIETMRNRMQIFETSQRRFDYSLWEYSQQLRLLAVSTNE